MSIDNWLNSPKQTRNKVVAEIVDKKPVNVKVYRSRGQTGARVGFSSELNAETFYQDAVVRFDPINQTNLINESQTKYDLLAICKSKNYLPVVGDLWLYGSEDRAVNPVRMKIVDIDGKDIYLNYGS